MKLRRLPAWFRIAIPRLCAIIDKCLRQKFRSRYQNAEELHEALSQLRPQGANERIPEGNPYRGLLPFEAEHRALFFGRRSEIGTLIERLRTEAAVLIGAESGIGKSSLCRAGVLPLVAEGALGGGRTYQVVQLVPGPHPLQSLSAALARVLGVTEAALTFQMGRDPGGFGRALLQHLGDSRGILLFVDQLEELATLSDPTEANIVGEALGSLLTRYPGIRLLMTVRSDFLGRVAMVSGIGEAVTRVLYILRPLSGDRIREAIVGPAHAKGVLFESPALVQSLVESTAHTDGGLPLLQFTLAELWEEREGNSITAAALSAIGGVSGALARHADHVLASLPPDKRAAAKRILIALVTMEGTRARRSEEELVRENPNAKVALEALVRGRLLVARDTPEGPAYDVAHEALIRGWDSLRHWLEEFKESRAARQRLESAAAEWRRQSKHRDALWNARQLRDLALLSSEEIGPREREFASASQAAVRKQRLRRSTSFLAVPILVGLSFGGAQLAERRTRQRALTEHMTEGLQLLAKARQQTRQVEEARQQSFTSFDSGKHPEGERLWERAQELAGEADRIYSRAGQTFEGVLTNDANNHEARTLLADSLYERALAAERDHHPQQTDDLLQRLALYDLGGARKRLWEAPAKLTIDSNPGPATVEVARYERDAQKRWTAEKLQPLGQTPLRNIELSPGSYLLTLVRAGSPPIRYPIRLTRGSSQQITVPLPSLEQVPKGFVYIPPGSFLFGSADDLLRKAFLATTPIHPVQTAGYLMAVHETTFGDWLEYLRAQPPEKRATLLLKGGGNGSSIGTGSVELSELPGGIWQLSLKPAGQSFVVKEGEFLTYQNRKQRSRQDWLKLPIGGVTLDEAAGYAQWLASTGRVPNARLCNEVEWERAARGADEREWPHADELQAADANFDETYQKDATTMGPDEVGSYPASRSPFGIDDLAGNVFEWTQSRQALDDGLVRSGGYFHSSVAQRSTNRNVIGRSLRDPNVGIRICADIAPVTH
jgi:formylglycine-generating enzyme required for sulfatase activity